MAKANTNRKSTGRNETRVKVDLDNLDSVLGKDISDFVTQGSLYLFELFELDYDFLETDPTLWKSNESYNNCLTVFKDMKVVNDIAERAIALISKYNCLLTKNEKEKQCMLRTTEYLRKKFPNCHKKTFMSNQDSYSDCVINDQ